MPQMKKKNNNNNIWGHHAHLGDKLCGRPRAKLPKFGHSVAVVGFIYFLRKMNPFIYWKENAVMKFNLDGSIK